MVLGIFNIILLLCSIPHCIHAAINVIENNACNVLQCFSRCQMPQGAETWTSVKFAYLGLNLRQMPGGCWWGGEGGWAL